MILVPGGGVTIPATEVSRRPTRIENAWESGVYLTVQLYDSLTALRVHVGAGQGAVTSENVHLVAGAGLAPGRWYAIGDFIQPYGEYISSRSLPRTPSRFGPRSMFTEAAIVTFEAGVVLNVGRASALFGHSGGGEQAEFLEGPAARVTPLHGTWSRSYGRA